MDIKKNIAALISVSIIAMGLGGCGRNSLEEVNLKVLEEKYGKEFAIKERFASRDLIAYPVDDPELIFYTNYLRHSLDSGYDEYQHEIVARRYKRLAEEKFDELGFKYKYYLDVDAYFINEETQDGDLLDFMLISDDSDLDNFPSNYSYSLEYDFFILEDALEMTDEEIFDLFSEIQEINTTRKYGTVRLFFVNNTEYLRTLDHYANYTDIEPWGVTKFYHYLTDNYWVDIDEITSDGEEPYWRAVYIINDRVFSSDADDHIERITTFEEFEEDMALVRKNVLYR